MNDVPGRYLLGNALHVRILTTSEDTDGRHDVVDAYQFPNTATPLHLHTRYEERLAIVEGSCTIWVGSDTLQLRVGDFATIPLNVPHAVKAGPRGCRSFLVTSPAGFAELIARTATPDDGSGAGAEMDAELFAAVSAELGDQLLGPPGMVPADLR
ncbi:cupin domain-containing protein [Mycolicibacterium mengxianglii]|uniref:cupin domain-containing protein n=1 Tax=Mycolicibacterium mengxianglii TaxID=2736649 RepID=UPI0018EF0C09|nr:cupin domain-containing protein [Mycolicibacterium mengxianglii]